MTTHEIPIPAEHGRDDVSRFNGLVPWCITCDRFLSPSTVRADGTCPACGRAVDAGRAHPPGALETVDAAVTPVVASGSAVGHVDAGTDADDDRPPIPWHLWLLLAALAVYLGYRSFQGLEWIFGF